MINSKLKMKNFLLRKMLESKMKDIPKEQRDKFIEVVEKNPDFFQKIAEEVQVEMENGKDQTTATMEVIQRYQSELQNIVSN